MEKGEDKGIGWVDLAVDHGESGEVELVGSEGGRVARLRQHLVRGRGRGRVVRGAGASSSAP